VALRYSQALFAGDFAAAARYVTPASRNTLLALTDGLSGTSLTSRDLAVGSVSISGSSAVAVLTGTICSSRSMAPLSSSGPSAHDQCLTNTDPHSASPAFQVELSRGPDGQWVVVYLMPSAEGSGAGDPTSSTRPAP
jgi:hypothetical protein